MIQPSTVTLEGSVDGFCAARVADDLIVSDVILIPLPIGFERTDSDLILISIPREHVMFDIFVSIS